MRYRGFEFPVWSLLLKAEASFSSCRLRSSEMNLAEWNCCLVIVLTAYSVHTVCVTAGRLETELKASRLDWLRIPPELKVSFCERSLYEYSQWVTSVHKDRISESFTTMMVAKRNTYAKTLLNHPRGINKINIVRLSKHNFKNTEDGFTWLFMH